MKQSIITTLFTAIAPCIFAQQAEIGISNDSLRLYNMQEVVVTATRVPQELIHIPQRIQVLPIYRLKANPSLSADDVLNQVSGLNLVRTMGILSKSTLVSVRGMGNEQGRTLLLIDGVSMNKTSTGSANLNRISPDVIERVEIVKGPGSSLYGGNAMGGVVNLITRRPQRPFEGSAAFGWGEMGTYTTNASIGGVSKSFYYQANGFYQKSNGYNTTPVADRTTSDIASFMHEYALNGMVGVTFRGLQSLEGSVRYYDGTRGDGTRYFFEDPGKGHLDLFNQYKQQDYRITYRGSAGDTHWTASGFYGQEKYLETKSKSSDLYDVSCTRRDWSVWAHGYNESLSNQIISAGLELKGGYVDGRDIYRTATDEVIDQGKSLLFGVWLQDELSFLDGHFKVVPELRLDVAHIYDGGFFIHAPTSITEIYSPYT